MKTIMMYSLIGGVGRTTITFNLARYMATQGERVMAIDADPQQNLSEDMGSSKRKLRIAKNFEIIRCTENISGCIQSLKLKQKYDYCFIDAGPAGSEITKTAFISSDYYFIPAIPDLYNAEAVVKLLGMVRNVSTALAGALPNFLGFIINNPYKPESGIENRENMFVNMKEIKGQPVSKIPFDVSVNFSDNTMEPIHSMIKNGLKANTNPKLYDRAKALP